MDLYRNFQYGFVIDTGGSGIQTDPRTDPRVIHRDFGNEDSLAPHAPEQSLAQVGESVLRLLGSTPIGYVPPGEYEEAFYRPHQAQAEARTLKQTCLR